MKNCKDCKHYHALDSTCRRRPPTAATIQTPTQDLAGQINVNVRVISVWPPVQPAQGHYCGEFDVPSNGLAKLTTLTQEPT